MRGLCNTALKDFWQDSQLTTFEELQCDSYSLKRTRLMYIKVSLACSHALCNNWTLNNSTCQKFSIAKERPNQVLSTLCPFR